MTKLTRATWNLAWAAATVLGAIGCVSTYVIVPRSGGTVAKVARGELAFEAVPNAWRDDPPDLGDYVTPIWVRVVNGSNQELQLTYVDFTLTNSTGTSFQVVSPYSAEDRVSERDAPRHGGSGSLMTTATSASGVVAGALGEPTRYAPDGCAETSTSDWYLAKPGQREERLELARGDDDAARVEFARYRGRPGPYAPAYGGIYYGPPSYFGSYGYYGIWPYYGPYFYGHRGYYWVDRYAVLPTAAMKQLGLREGVLRAGAHASGFLYFRHAATEETNLDLSWSPRSTRGTSLASMTVPLRVVED